MLLEDFAFENPSFDAILIVKTFLSFTKMSNHCIVFATKKLTKETLA